MLDKSGILCETLGAVAIPPPVQIPAPVPMPPNRTVFPDHTRVFRMVARVVVPVFLAWPHVSGQPLRIMPLGDSITRGTNDINYPNGDIPGGYRRKLGELLAEQEVTFDFVGEKTDNAAPGMDPDHNGNNGWRTDQMLGGLNTWLARDPQTVLLMAGTNDVLQGVPIGQALGHLENLIIKITSTLPSCRLHVATIPPITQDWQGQTAAVLNAKADSYNDGVRALVATHAAAGRKVFLADMNALIVLDDPDSPLDFYQPGDGIHPGQAGYDQLGTLWFNAITAEGPLTDPPLAGAPLKRTGFTANVVTPSRVNLSWSNPPDDGHPVSVWMRGLPHGVWERVATLQQDAVSHAVTGLSAGDTSYRFAVEAVNAQGSSGWSGLATTAPLGSASGGELALLKPASASTFYSMGGSHHPPPLANDGSINTFWASNGLGPHWWQVDLGASHPILKIELVTRQAGDVADQRRNFEIRISDDPAFATYTTLGGQGSAPLAFKAALTLNLPSVATGRYIRVAKTDTASFSIAELRVTSALALQTPTAPTGLSGEALVPAGLRLSWTITSQNESGFRIERRDTPAGQFLPVAQLPALATVHEDSGLVPGNLYAYRVIAVNELGDSPPSPELAVTLDPYDPYFDWAAAQPGFMELPEADRLPGADPNRDGVVNLLAYALGMNPLLPADPARMPRLTGSPPDMRLEFVRRISSPDLVYQLQTSASAGAGSWSPVSLTGVPVVPHPTDPAFEIVTLPVPIPSEGGDRAFFRLWVIGSAFTD